MGKKIKLALVLPFNLKFGEGLSNVCLAYYKFLPREKFDVRIIQTDFYRNERLKDPEISEKVNKGDLITLLRPDKKLLKVIKRGPIGLFYSVFIEPLFIKHMGKKFRSDYEDYVKQLDFAYVFNNNMRFLFRDTNVIGSTHSWNPELSSKIKFVYHKYRVNKWKLDLFHAFPRNLKFFSELDGVKSFSMDNGIESEKYWPPAINVDSGKVRFLFVSRLEPCKGIDILPQAWSRVKRREDASLRIVGTGSSKKTVEGLAYSESSVEYLGHLDQKELIDLYRNSDVILFPSTCDTYGLVVLEGLASGMHCIVDQSLAGTFDVFSNNGFVEYIKHNPDDFAQAIDRSISAISNFRKSKKETHDLVKEKFSWEMVLKSLSDFIEQLDSSQVAMSVDT